MCTHPRCTLPVAWTGEGPPYGKVTLCEAHKRKYAAANPEMKWINHQAALDAFHERYEEVFGE